MSDSEKKLDDLPQSIKSESKAWSWSGSLLPGLLLIVLGLFFLANNLTGFELENWWALFILIPAVNNFSAGLAAMRSESGLSRKARGHFFWSLFFVLLSSAFLLEVDFGLLWPAFLILAGFGVLLDAF